MTPSRSRNTAGRLVFGVWRWAFGRVWRWAFTERRKLSVSLSLFKAFGVWRKLALALPFYAFSFLFAMQLTV